jgi:hypothetical protein
VTWSDARCVRAMATARTAGAMCSIRWWHGIAAGVSGAYYAAMRPSRSRMCTSTWRRRASSTRSACPRTRCSRIRSPTCSRARWGGHRTTSALVRELPLPGAELEPAASRGGEGRVAPRRAAAPRRLHRDEPPRQLPPHLALPGEVERWSLTSLREKVVKIGAKVIAHGRYTIFQMA